MNILLARHGETPWNKEGRYQGHTDIPLSTDGEAQARALGARLQTIEIHRAVASPLQRARRTAELALGDRARLLTLDPDLVEIHHGGWEGKLASEIELTDPTMLQRWRQHPSADLPAGPGAESLGHVTTRAWRALEHAVAGMAAHETLLLVAHDAVNRALICKIMGLDIERVWSFQQSPATLNAITGSNLAELQVVRLNDASHHSAIFSAAAHRAL